MANNWNGQALVDEFAAALSDTSTAFKTRVLAWINEIQKDICARHDWPFLKEKGRKRLRVDNSIETEILFPASETTQSSISNLSFEHSNVTQTEDFSSDSGFTYDSDKAEFVDGTLRQKLADNDSLTFNQPFDSADYFVISPLGTSEIIGSLVRQVLTNLEDENFVEDFTSGTFPITPIGSAEVTGGLVRQVDQIPADSETLATYTNDINLNYGGGTPTGTATGGAAVAAGRLDLAHNDLRYVSYATAGNISSTQTGAVKFKYTPNYSNAPASDRRMFNLTQDPYGGSEDFLAVEHMASGPQLRVMVASSAPAWINLSSLGAWNPTSGQTYEFELNWDVTAGETRLFIDGVQFGATMTGTGTRGTNYDTLHIGTSHNKTSTSNFYIEDIVFFDAVQHTANYTAGYSLAEKRYIEAKIELPVFTYSGAGSLQEWTNMTTVNPVGTPKYILNDLYYSGGWVASNGTFAESTSLADILTNIATLPAADSMNVDVVFGESDTISSVSEVDLEYTGQTYPVSKVSLPTFTYAGGGDIQAFTNFETTEANAPKYIINDLWFNGASWVASNGTYLESNSKADILTNIATLPMSDTVDIDITFTTDTTVSSVSDLTITYTGQTYLDSLVQLPAMTEITDAYVSFSTTETGSPKYIVNNYYYDSSLDLWALSDNTLSKANTSAEINSEYGEFPLTGVGDHQHLQIEPPYHPPAVALASGGSLTEGSTYSVKITFHQHEEGIDSLPSAASASVTTDAANKSISVTNIPVSLDPDVEERHIFLKKDDGDYYFLDHIYNNNETTYTVTADTSSTVLPPDFCYIGKLLGSPFFEGSPSRQLEYMPIDQARFIDQGKFSVGAPMYWSILSPDRLLLNPSPDQEYILSYYFFKTPKDLYYETAYPNSSPDIPVWLKPVLRAGVIMLGYEYRDRDGQESKRNNYYELLANAASRMGSPAKIPRRVRDVEGDSDGYEVY